jgi:hypothetical protein
LRVFSEFVGLVARDFGILNKDGKKNHNHPVAHIMDTKPARLIGLLLVKIPFALGQEARRSIQKQ